MLSTLKPSTTIIHDPSKTRLPWLLWISFGLCFLIFTATIPLPRVDGHLVGSDGLSYYAILRSWFFDRDFNYTNDYQLLGEQYIIFSYTDQNLPTNPFAIGSAILWFPFFSIAHVLSLLLTTAGMQVPTNGTGYIYEAAVCYGTILYASIGFWLVYRLAARLFSSQAALIATLTLWWASQAIYYIIAEPSMSHGITIFTVALFLWCWYPPRTERSLRDWAMLGAVTGLVALGRWQDGVIALVPIIELVWWVYKRQLSFQRALICSLVFIICITLVFLPQLFMWRTIYGSYFTIPQGNDFFNWTNPKIVETLFSTHHGLFSWHPVLLLACFGIIPLWRRSLVLTLTSIGLLVFQLYINSSVGRWWADDAFGGRRFISLIPLFVLLLTALIATVAAHWRRLIYGACILLLIWNGLSFAQYRLGFVSKGEALTIKEMTVDRVLLPWQLVQRVLQ
jgi:hypothetical protein